MNQEKIREVALLIDGQLCNEGYVPTSGAYAIELLTRCLQELSKDADPVAYYDCQAYEFYWAKPTRIDAPVTVNVEPVPLYSAPPLTEQDKLDAERYRYLRRNPDWLDWDIVVQPELPADHPAHDDDSIKLDCSLDLVMGRVVENVK